jgi:hypothetical protein
VVVLPGTGLRGSRVAAEPAWRSSRSMRERALRYVSAETADVAPGEALQIVGLRTFLRLVKG